ncbi:hypothetical protein M441DRAFT_325054 [Trichoderma asperellum CBS 433.97]|uniref:Uncharacterized protein n=1 Tax=Trichoderma asperellum (strain ATCC 204424 / CBS 433.97 / NBRC 101777) TaxID=1042311 RepID=A0A2T3ZLV7_TRIA4|nr:hypothetical protein M441DRAFT_325054 [Trichoderma asperellum CBS 433.97]PTB45781.1 hypothetical protein M441DRAFT_325054 [Trichoderma asperellum CBS 433.97]
MLEYLGLCEPLVVANWRQKTRSAIAQSFPPPAVRSSQHGSVSCKKINSTFVYDLTAALCMYISVLTMGDDLGMAVSTSNSIAPILLALAGVSARARARFPSSNAQASERPSGPSTPTPHNYRAFSANQQPTSPKLAPPPR